MEDKNEDKKSNIKTINTSFIDYLGDLYEQVYDKDSEGTFFVKYSKLSQEIEGVVEKVEINETIYKPIYNDFVKKEFIYLSSEAKEYNNLSTLLQLIQQYIHKYLDITEFGEVLSSYYILLSWIYDNFETIPYLRFIGDYGTGKSRGLKVIGSICYKPIFAGGAITPSPIFRLIEQFKGTLVIDEADFSISEHFAEIIKILNSKNAYYRSLVLSSCFSLIEKKDWNFIFKVIKNRLYDKEYYIQKLNGEILINVSIKNKTIAKNFILNNINMPQNTLDILSSKFKDLRKIR